MVLGSLAIYLLTALHIVKSKHRMILIGVLMVIALMQVGVGLVQFSRGNDFMLFGYGRAPGGNRASGQYVSPNHLAGYLEVVAIIGISLVFLEHLETLGENFGGIRVASGTCRSRDHRQSGAGHASTRHSVFYFFS